MSYHFIPINWANIKKLDNDKCGCLCVKNIGKQEPSHIASEMRMGAAILRGIWNNLGIHTHEGIAAFIGYAYIITVV